MNEMVEAGKAVLKDYEDKWQELLCELPDSSIIISAEHEKHRETYTKKFLSALEKFNLYVKVGFNVECLACGGSGKPTRYSKSSICDNCGGKGFHIRYNFIPLSDYLKEKE